jgi:hypothetical protein
MSYDETNNNFIIYKSDNKPIQVPVTLFIFNSDSTIQFFQSYATDKKYYLNYDEKLYGDTSSGKEFSYKFSTIKYKYDYTAEEGKDEPVVEISSGPKNVDKVFYKNDVYNCSEYYSESSKELVKFLYIQYALDDRNVDAWLYTKNQVFRMGSTGEECMWLCPSGSNDDCFFEGGNYYVGCGDGKCRSSSYEAGRCTCTKGSKKEAKWCIHKPNAQSCPTFGFNNSIRPLDAEFNGGSSTTSPYGLDSNTKMAQIVCKYNLKDFINNATEGDINIFKQKFTDLEKYNTGQIKIGQTSRPVNLNDSYNTIMKGWCGKPSGSTINAFSKQDCIEWCTNNPTECTALKSIHCRGENLNTGFCLGFCGSTPGYVCEDNIQEYCNSISDNAVKLTKPICGCFMGSDFYSKYFNGIKKAFPGLSELFSNLPQCSFPNCSTSQVKPRSFETNPCPDISACIQYAEVNNSGTITGDINITQSSDCIDKFKRAVSSCKDGEALTLNQTECKACPSNQTPSSDKYCCLDVNSNNPEVDAKCTDKSMIYSNGECKACDAGKVPDKCRYNCINSTQNFDYNPTTKKCEVNSNGKYTTEKDCRKDNGLPYKFGCVNNTCDYKVDGEFEDEASCRRDGKCNMTPPSPGPSPGPSDDKKYSCNFFTSGCKEDSNGKYSSLEECEKECRKSALWFYLSVGIVLLIIIIFIIYKLIKK